MATQLNNWLSIDKVSGTGNAQITLTASSYSELVDRAASLRIQSQSTNAILNVRQKAYTPIEKNNNYFWIEFENTGGEVSNLGNSWTDIYYSFDANTWTAVDSTGVVSLGTKRLVYLKNNTKKLFKDLDNHTSITFNSNAKIGGDLSSMTDMIGDCCENLFYNNTYLVDASELILPWATLADNCYCRMFQGCTNLITAPVLPATTLAVYCYVYMFCDCTSLVTAPELSATALVEGCYFSMFNGCKGIVTAPALPATTLANRCYSSMFQDCTSLVNAPVLPATTLTKECYRSMFLGCSSLVNAPVLPATTLADYCYNAMFYNCTSLVTAPALPVTTLAVGCYGSMFDNCTSLVNAPVLPATTLTKECYRSMFKGCTNLITAPVLPATTLADRCYNSMFYNCTSLNYIKMLSTDISASNCLYDWVNGVPSTGTFVKHPDANIPTGRSGIPSGWTVETATE